MKCYILLPCYNEEKNLKPLISKIDDELEDTDYQVIAINDGSTDRTEKILQELSKSYPVKILNHEKNLGLHMAMKTGITEIIEYAEDEDVIITMDADNTHNPEYIREMLKKIKEGNDIVVASRYVEGGKQLNVPFHRVILSIGINKIMRLFSGIPVKDQTTGYRCYKALLFKNAINSLKEEFITSRGFEVSVELLTKSYYYGGGNVKVTEIPIVLDYGKKKGKSKMRLFSTIFLYLRLLNKIREWKGNYGK